MPGEQVVRDVLVAATPAETWEALVEPARLEEWLADEVEADVLAPDARVVFRWDDGRERRGVVEAVEAPRRLSFRWSADDGRESRVAFTLAPAPGGTRVTVTESGLRAHGGSWGPRLAALGGVARAALV